MVVELPGPTPTFVASAGGYPLRDKAGALKLFRTPERAAEALEDDLSTHASALQPTG